MHINKFLNKKIPGLTGYSARKYYLAIPDRRPCMMVSYTNRLLLSRHFRRESVNYIGPNNYDFAFYTKQSSAS